MTVELFMTMLTGCAIATSLIVEACKRFCNVKAYNLLALVVGIVVGAFVCFLAYIELGVSFSTLNILYMVAFTVANATASMVGYDKVKQAIEQIMGK